MQMNCMHVYLGTRRKKKIQFFVVKQTVLTINHTYHTTSTIILFVSLVRRRCAYAQNIILLMTHKSRLQRPRERII